MISRGSVRIRVVVLLAAAALVAQVALVSGSSGAASSGRLIPLRVAVPLATATLPVNAALDKGIFTKNGLKVTLVPNPEPLDTTGFVDDLTSGQVDVALSMPADLGLATSQGVPMRMFAGLTLDTKQVPAGVTITAPGTRPITNVTQLKGKRLGIASASSSLVYSIKYLAKQAGLSPTDITYVITPNPSLGDAIKAGTIDAAVTTSPFYNSLKDQGFTIGFDPILPAIKELGGKRPAGAVVSGFWATMASYAKNNPKAIAAFRKSMDQAYQYQLTHPKWVQSQLTSLLKIDPTLAKSVVSPRLVVPVSADDLTPWFKLLKANGILNNSVPPAKTLVIPGS
jgi:NitT/TauT family transport system substrate-binding protein